MTQVIPVTQARKDLLKLVDQIDENYTRVDLTKNGRIKATLVSPDYLDSLEETIYTLQHSMKDIKSAEKEIAKGNFVTLEEIKTRFNKLPRTKSPRFSLKVYKKLQKTLTPHTICPAEDCNHFSIHPRFKKAGFSASDYKKVKHAR